MPGVTWMSRLAPACVVVAGISIITPAYDFDAGMVEIKSFEMVVCRRTLCMSTIGVSPVTVIVSCKRADLQVRVDRRGERSGQLDALALDGAEAGQRERDRIGAGPQVDDAVLAAAVGDGGADLFNQHVARGLDGDAGQHGAGRVLDDAGDGGLANAVAGRITRHARTSSNPFNTRIRSP